MADTMDTTRADAPIPAGPDSVSAHDLVIEDILAWYAHDPSLFTAAVETLAARKFYGLGKYDTILHKDDGRPAGQDAEDEALDLVVYLRNWMDKHPAMGSFLAESYRDAVFLLIMVTNARHSGFVPSTLAKCSGMVTPVAELREQLLHSTDEGLALRGDIPRTETPIYVCGGMQRNEHLCMRRLDAEGRCPRHGERRVES